jgi:hypothetical protein
MERKHLGMHEVVERDGREGSYAMAVTVAVVTAGAALFFAFYLGLPMRDPDGFLGPTFVRLPVIAGLMLAVDVVPRAILRVRGLDGLWAESKVIFRDRWPVSRLLPALIGLLAFYATYVGYRNLKNYLPLLRPELVDDELRALDHQIAGGAPADMLHDLLGTGVSAHVLSWVYLAYLMFVPLSLGLALIPIGRAREAAWYVTALCLNWSLGAASYYVLPSMGPIYAEPGLFSDLPETGTSALQNSLLVSRSMFLDDPGGERIQSIAAFASLHVSVVFTAALIAQFTLRSVAAKAVMWVFFVMTTLATIYFGWHYIVDDVAGLAIGAASVLLGAWGTGQFRRRPEVVFEPLPEAVGAGPGDLLMRFRRRPQTSTS